MPLYRNLRQPLDIGKGRLIEGEGRGIFHSSIMASAHIDILEGRGLIARISAPPLGELPGWKTRSAKLAKAGIMTVEGFMEAPDDELAVKLKVKPGLVAQFKAEVIGLLSSPKPRG